MAKNAATVLPVPTVRVNPPSDVQQKVSAAIAACRDWQPVVVDKLPAQTTEAWACDHLAGGPEHEADAFYATLVFGAILGVMAVLTLRGAYLVARGVYRWLRESRSLRALPR